MPRYYCDSDTDSNSDCECDCECEVECEVEDKCKGDRGPKGEKGNIGNAGPKGQKGDSGNGSGELDFWEESAGTNAAGVSFSLFTPKSLGNIRFAAMTVEEGAGFTWNRTVVASDRPQPLGLGAVDLQLESTDGKTAFGPNSAILSGTENRTGQYRSVIVGGEHNFVEGALSGIGWGNLHRIESAAGDNFTLNSGIGWGSENEIRAGFDLTQNCRANHCTVTGGLRNWIHALTEGSIADYATIGGGNDNKIQLGCFNPHLQGTPESSLQGGLITGGSHNTIILACSDQAVKPINSKYCAIHGGETNIITNNGHPFDTHHSNILGGHFNKIQTWFGGSARDANVLGGYGNTASADYARTLGNYNTVFPNLVPKASPGTVDTLPAYMLATFGNQTEVHNLAATVLGYNGDDETELRDTTLSPIGRVAFANGTARSKRTTQLFGKTKCSRDIHGRYVGESGMAATDVFASNNAGGLATYMKFATDTSSDIIAQPYGWLVTVTADGIRLATKNDYVDGVTTAPTVGVVTDTQLIDGGLYETDDYGNSIADPTYLDGVFDYLQDQPNLDAIRAFAVEHDTPNIAIALGEAGLITSATALELNQYIYRNYAVRKRAIIPEIIARTLDPQWVPVTSTGPTRVNCIPDPIPFVGSFVSPTNMPGFVIIAPIGATVIWRVLKIINPGGFRQLAVIMINMTSPPPPPI